MTPFEKAMDEYFDHFEQCYPYAIGYGYPGKDDDENIKIIRECIEADTPVAFTPPYDPDKLY